jgi:uridine monophosphate synthetase
VRSYDTYGIPYGESQARFREALEIIRLAFTGEAFSYEGHFYRIPNAPLSPFYLNLRTKENPKPGPLTPKLVTDVGRLMWYTARRKELTYSHIAGVPRAGDPLAKSVADFSKRVQIRLNKEEGGGRRTVGTVIKSKFDPDDVVLLVDDLITKADSKLEAIAVLKAAGLQIIDIIVIVDWEQGGAAQLNERGYALHALFTITELLELYVAEGRMTEAERADIVAYLRANA